MTHSSDIIILYRTVYRAVEFLGGWEGGVARTEVYFVLFDATPIALALLILNVFTPCVLLQGAVAS